RHLSGRGSDVGLHRWRISRRAAAQPLGRVHHDEVYFRDTAHGFLAWAFATVLTATVLGGATTHILAGASAGMAPAAASSANSAGNPTDIYVEKLLRVDADTAPAAAGPTPLGEAAGSSGSAQQTRVSNYYGTRAELGR